MFFLFFSLLSLIMNIYTYQIHFRVLILLSLLGLAIATEDVFLNFAKEFNKSYKDGKDLVSRR